MHGKVPNTKLFNHTAQGKSKARGERFTKCVNCVVFELVCEIHSIYGAFRTVHCIGGRLRASCRRSTGSTENRWNAARRTRRGVSSARAATFWNSWTSNTHISTSTSSFCAPCSCYYEPAATLCLNGASKCIDLRKISSVTVPCHAYNTAVAGSLLYL